MPSLAVTMLGVGVGVCWPAVARVREVRGVLGWWTVAAALVSPVLIAAGTWLIPRSMRIRPEPWWPAAVGALLGGVCLVLGGLIALALHALVMAG